MDTSSCHPRPTLVAFQPACPLAGRHDFLTASCLPTRPTRPTRPPHLTRHAIAIAPSRHRVRTTRPTDDISYSSHNRRRTIVCATNWNNLSVREFDRLLDTSSLPLCFIGMSNCGKSHWSRQLQARLNFHVVSVDDHIETSLKPILSRDGHVGISGLADWMGFPSDSQFARNQATYLDAEERITAGASPQAGRNSVLDTTGSVVYLSRETRERICASYLVVHLEAGDDLLHVMTENYFQTPKPVVWGDAYARHEGEPVDDALRRCYPNLLKERRHRYATMAHVTIPASKSLSPNLNVAAFLDELRAGLPAGR